MISFLMILTFNVLICNINVWVREGLKKEWNHTFLMAVCGHRETICIEEEDKLLKLLQTA